MVRLESFKSEIFGKGKKAYKFHLFLFCFFICLGTKSHSVVQAGLEDLILLPYSQSDFGTTPICILGFDE